MSINITSVKSFHALEAICQRLAWRPLCGYMEPAHLAWLVYQLKYLPDNAVDFPNGKWALIQHLWTLLDEEAKAEVEYSLGKVLAG